jgi:hypothetical protein
MNFGEERAFDRLVGPSTAYPSAGGRLRAAVRSEHTRPLNKSTQKAGANAQLTAEVNFRSAGVGRGTARHVAELW